MTTSRKFQFEDKAWIFMRYSSILLIPLVWIHVLWQDVIIGVHNIDLNYVLVRWSNIGIQIYDIALLTFAFAHGMNGLRQVLMDYIHGEKTRSRVSILLLILWLVISTIGAVAILAAAKAHLQ